MVTKLEVGDKAFIVESNRIVREMFILKKVEIFILFDLLKMYPVVYNLGEVGVLLQRKTLKAACLRNKYRREQDFVLRMSIYRNGG